ncbi:MAG: prealbumin-like fold domain-containing protein, partial [Defluviitaleaceae bacterium]|nr:prealbumin-like fold domain-containing protein [Defluviitaleaceae bacterium]
HSGVIVISGLDPGYFVVEETVPPSNFTLSANNRQHAFLRPDGTSIVEVTFSNLPYSSMIITLRCSVTGAPIPNGEFKVTNSGGAVVGTDNGHFWTNLQGEILIPNVVPDSYVVTQVTVPPQYVIQLVQSTQTIRVDPTGRIYRVDFFSDPLSNLLITLRCEVTGQPVQGGEFRITNSAGNVVGSTNGIFFTDLQGEILIPGLGVDSYVVTQLNAPDGFRLGTRRGNKQPNDFYTTPRRDLRLKLHQ